ncbi:EAL domain-containing response regulator [Stenotrophomonas mori]|uniref:EAL domain-containing response regulator n=1 Tax=Stenotrophomonas mori TaxID=2871096 RepID=A0ABT0SJQ5_9GAMM|nr:EAL domain-containing response regulator [Stenotrophomonas mori]MCL7715561.1 EAL domain-containing response regulator [Stenotrophomonas mori]
MNPDYRILTLDDHPLQCLHVETVLQGIGLHNVHHACSAAEAMQQLRRHRHQLVIMDLDMPDSDGVQFLDCLAGTPLEPWLAICSACDGTILKSVERMARARGLPVIGTFPKPFSTRHALTLRQRLCQAPPRVRRGTGSAAPHVDAASLLRALDSGAIHGRFQPKVDVASGRIVGAEVLARWQHPQSGLIAPAAFLPVVQRHRLDRELLLRMVRDGLEAHGAWHARGHVVPFSVNLPVPLLEIPDLPDQLAAMVADAGVAPADVVFELLEDMPIHAVDLFHRGVSRLRLKGFGLSQDDFGRGYSSMYNLVSTPFTEMKIDRAFVSGAWNDEARHAVLGSAIELGRELGLTVTAEGVETADDLACLRRLGCDRAQGFLFAPAVDAAHFMRLLEDKPPTI